MKSTRIRAIEKSISFHARTLITTFDGNEHLRAVCGQSFLSVEREVEILKILNHYAKIMDRIYKNEKPNKELLYKLSMYL